jgi:hypothetical protein
MSAKQIVIIGQGIAGSLTATELVKRIRKAKKEVCTRIVQCPAHTLYISLRLDLPFGKCIPGDRPVLKQQAMPVPAVIVPVYSDSARVFTVCRIVRCVSPLAITPLLVPLAHFPAVQRMRLKSLWLTAVPSMKQT